MSTLSYLPVTLGIFGLFCAFLVYGKMKSASAGSGKVVEIGDQIHLGAMVFMKAEYSRLAIFCVICIAALGVSDLGWSTASAFFLGAICSGTAGYIGMYAATKANVRTATAAQDQGASAALTVAFFGGSVMGLTVASMGLLGLGILYLVFGSDPHTAHVIHGFGIPEMRVKQDALPGMTIPVYFTPTMTSAEFINKIKDTNRYSPSGNYMGLGQETWEIFSEEKKNEFRGFQIACAQLCGNSHYKMRGFVTVETEEEFNAWLEEEAEYLEEEDEDDDW